MTKTIPSLITTLAIGSMISVIGFLWATNNMELSNIPLIGIILSIAGYILYLNNSNTTKLIKSEDQS